MTLIFGFDIGTTSVGWAVVREGEDAGKIEKMGVRIFPETRDSKTLETLNQTRRAKRIMRRQLRRKKWRRRHIQELLREAGLLPGYGTLAWRTLMQSDPYALRVKALHEKLSPEEVGRTLYALLKRRGYHSNSQQLIGEEGNAEDTDTSKKVETLRDALHGQTLGQFLIHQPRKRLGKLSFPQTSDGQPVYPGRSMVQDEFDQLWKSQARFHKVLTNILKEKVAAAAFRQRPVFWRENTLGKCHLEPQARLCPKASWLAQEFECLQKLANLQIMSGNRRPLDEKERQIIHTLMHQQKSISWTAARKALKTYWQESGTPMDSRFNYEVGGDTKGLPGNGLEVELAKLWGETWSAYPKQQLVRDEIGERLRAIYYQEREGRILIRREESMEQARQDFLTHAEKAWGASPEQARELAGIQPKPAWLRHSTNALRKILPHLKQGVSYSHAVDREYPGWRERLLGNERGLPNLPSGQDKLPETRNPSVKRTMNELRKVVNNLIRVYGKPDWVRIELARDLKQSKAEREATRSDNNKREKERALARKELEANGFSNPKSNDLEKWLLWKEGNEYCPYTVLLRNDKSVARIGFDDLFGSNPQYQIEHIFPLSRSLDNSWSNKTLCRVDLNREKGNQSPHEWLATKLGKEVYEERVGHLLTDLFQTVERRDRRTGRVQKNLRNPKVGRFLRESFDELGEGDDSFSERQLRDTAYAAKLVRNFLLRLFPDQVEENVMDPETGEVTKRAVPETRLKVQTTNGRVTAALRRQWGLNHLLDKDGAKNRDDHRHHAVDALAVALSTPGVIQRLAKFYQQDRESYWQATAERATFAEPWPGFHHEAKERVAEIIVSHKVRRKVSGPLHEETTLGLTNLPLETEGKGKNPTTYHFFVKRKELTSLTKSEAENIRDVSLREKVKAALAEGDPKKALADFTLETKSGPRPVRRVRILVKCQPSLLAQLNKRTKGYAAAGENHHMAVYRLPNGKTDYEVVSRLEAQRRHIKREPIIRKTRKDGSKLIFSLCPGDTIAFPRQDKTGTDYRIVSSLWANGGQTVLSDHDKPYGSVWSRPTAASLIKTGAYKISIDPIGRVRPARD